MKPMTPVQAYRYSMKRRGFGDDNVIRNRIWPQYKRAEEDIGKLGIRFFDVWFEETPEFGEAAEELHDDYCLLSLFGNRGT